jgi:hypothetical protein
MSASRLPRAARPALRFLGPAALAALLFVPLAALVGPQSGVPAVLGRWASFGGGADHAKIQSSLTRLALVERAEGPAEAELFARSRGLDWRTGRVRVVTVLESNPGVQVMALTTRAVRTHIEALGGTVQATWRNLVQHTLPLEALENLAADPFVRYIRAPLKPFKQTIVSEGVAKTGADLWHDLDPFKNTTPAKICILDAGFDGYRDLLGKDLPKTVTTRSFRYDGDITGGGEPHGAACAEIAYDMAPKAQMVLVNFETDVEQHAAVDWIVTQKVDVISCSLGWYNAGSGTGVGPIDDDPAYAASRGLVWANSAGNAAQDHWTGVFTDPDGNGYMNFDAAGTEILTFHVPAYETVGAFLNWKDWGPYDGYDYRGSAQDYDLELYYNNGSSWILVDSSTNRQTGTQWPVEEIWGYYASRTANWGVKIKRISGTAAVDLEFFSSGNDTALAGYNSARSVLVPAESPYVLAAGATDWSTDALHYYSSRGPSWGGLLKPDFTAPSGVSTSTYGMYNFYGTSASAPHLAGAIALLKGMTPYSIAQIKALLLERAVDLGAPGPDNLYGNGRLSVKK